MRRKGKMKILPVILLISMTVSGCRLGNTEVVVSSGIGKNEIFKMQDEVCTLSEARVFLANYRNIYATMYGVDLWKHKFKNNELENYIKELTVSQLAQIMAMDFLAQEKEISLSEEEMSQVKEAAESYYDSLNTAEKQYMRVDERDIEKLYARYGLANKLYTHLTGDVNAEVSDDEARVMEAMQIYVKEEDKAKEIESRLKQGADFVSLAGKYNEADEIETTFGRTDVPKGVEEVVFALEKDEVSPKIPSGNGWYFMKCINNYNQELTDANKSVILEKRRKEAFDDVYREYIKELPAEFNEKVWRKLR